MIQLLNGRHVFLHLVVFWFFLIGCTQLNGEPLKEHNVLEGRVLYESSEEPLAGIEVALFRLNKPLFSMRGWEKVGAVKTDENGYFKFEVSESGPYQIRWNPESDIIPHEFPVSDFEGKKYVEILHKDKKEKIYPWDHHKRD